MRNSDRTSKHWVCLVDCGVLDTDGGITALCQESIPHAWDFSIWELSLFT